MVGWSLACLGGDAVRSGLVLRKGRTLYKFTCGFPGIGAGGGCATGSGSGDGRSTFATFFVPAGIGDGGGVWRTGALQAGIAGGVAGGGSRRRVCGGSWASPGTPSSLCTGVCYLEVDKYDTFQILFVQAF